MNSRYEREKSFFNTLTDTQENNHENLSTWDIKALNLLGDIKDKTLLEIGCGTGFMTLELCRRGARVFAIDISPLAIEFAQKRLYQAGYKNNVVFYTGAFEQVDLLGHNYDLVFGKWILHHLSFEPAIDKINECLKSGGRAIFIETSYFNPIIKFARRTLSGRFGIIKIGTPDENPVSYNEIIYLQNMFSEVSLYFVEFSFFWLFDRHILKYKKIRWLGILCHKLDYLVTKHFPSLNKYGYYVIIELFK